MDPGHGAAAGADGAVAQPGKGGILYCVVARGATVLARLSLVKILQVIYAIYGTPAFHRHASCIGNFAEISDLVLAKVGLGLEMN